MPKETPLLPEKSVLLNSVEIELLLLDVHRHLAELLIYLDHQKEYLSSGPEGWLRLRVHTLRTMAFKLENSLIEPL